MATKAAYTFVNVGETDWAVITERARSPLEIKKNYTNLTKIYFPVYNQMHNTHIYTHTHTHTYWKPCVK